MPEDYLMHYGKGHLDGGHSGRYPWGSGDNPHQRDFSFYQQWKDLKKEGLSDKEAADFLHMSSKEARDKRTVEEEYFQRYRDWEIKKRLERGDTYTAIAKEMGVNEGTIRNRIKKMEAPAKQSVVNIADILEEELKTKKAIDIGKGVEKELGVSRERLNAAIKELQDRGYNYYPNDIQVQQATALPGQKTIMACIAQKDITPTDLRKDYMLIEPVRDYHSDDNGESFYKRAYPASIDSSRIYINYAENGGKDKDGVIELRPGVPDLSLGESAYAQVRIAVDDKCYMKGMAMYSNDIPDGYDVVYNTNKHIGTDPSKVFKPFKKDISGEVDKDNPFGAFIKTNGQSWYEDPKTGEKKLSAINKLKEEGEWDEQARNLASQFLSKQPIELIKTQLDLTKRKAKSEYEDIMSIENPTIRKQMLLDFASTCDEAAEELKAVALPRQSTKVILPLTCMKDNEIYAPTYNNGEHVVLVRYPHAGTFEIPELVVNNKKAARAILGQAEDAVGININVAAKLSGADFDGDTVVVIPVNDKVRVKSDPYPQALKDFEPDKYATGGAEGSTMTERQKGQEMGKVSNLITDMQIKGAPMDDIVKAVKHSMVVIDAYKHAYNWQQSEKDNDIAALKAYYQAESKMHGASTLLSRASGEARRDETKMFIPTRDIDPDTGEVNLRPSGRKYQDYYTKTDPDTGEKVKDYSRPKPYLTVAQDTVSRMALEKDASKLSSGSAKELPYVDYANYMKKLANDCRKEYLATKDYKVNESAKVAYADELESINKKLDLALAHSPRERQAQRIANIKIRALLHDHPELKQPEYKDKKGKYKNQALQDARLAVGANKKNVRVDLTDREWEAIQARALSYTRLQTLMRQMDSEKLKQRAMPRQEYSIPVTKQNTIKALARKGYTQSEIADALNISASTVSKYLKGE